MTAAAKAELRPLHHRVNDERGVTMIHFVLVFPIMFLVMVAVLDLGRYFAVVAVLNAGAERGLNMALKLPNLDTDYRGLDESDIMYQRYRTSRQMVTDEAELIPISSRFVSSALSPSDTSLVRMTVTDQGLGPGMTGTATPYQSDAAFLRPGECVTIAGYSPVCNNQTVFALPTGVADWPSPQKMLRNHPVMIVMRAEVDAFLPFIDKYVAMGVALGYKEEIPQGPLKGETPTPTPTPPSGSPTPMYTPGAPNGTPEPTPDPSTCPGKATSCSYIVSFYLSMLGDFYPQLLDTPYITNADCSITADCNPTGIGTGQVAH